MKIRMLKSTWVKGKAILMNEVADVNDKWAAYLIENAKAEAVPALKVKKKASS